MVQQAGEGRENYTRIEEMSMTFQDLPRREKLALIGITIGMAAFAAWWIAFLAANYQ